MDDFKLFSLIFSWGVVNILKFFLIVLFFVFLIYQIKRRYTCRVLNLSSSAAATKDFNSMARRAGGNHNDNR